MPPPQEVYEVLTSHPNCATQTTFCTFSQAACAETVRMLRAGGHKIEAVDIKELT